ncbi:MAG: hypothetical protein IPN42_08495 [Methylococcaceae bacterium]|nr:hypothetical protein [Methylococcaceae bacterium]
MKHYFGIPSTPNYFHPFNFFGQANARTDFVKSIVLIICTLLSTPTWAFTTEQRVRLLEEYVVGLKDRINALETVNTKLALQTTDLNNQLGTLLKSNTTLTATVDTLKTNVSNLTLVNTVLNSRIVSLETEHSSVKNQVALLQSELHAIKNNSALALHRKLNSIYGDNDSDETNCRIDYGFGKTESSGTWNGSFYDGYQNAVTSQYRNYTKYGGAIFNFAKTIDIPFATDSGIAFKFYRGI